MRAESECSMGRFKTAGLAAGRRGGGEKRGAGTRMLEARRCAATRGFGREKSHAVICTEQRCAAEFRSEARQR